jgi:hypothetical protein
VGPLRKKFGELSLQCSLKIRLGCVAWLANEINDPMARNLF